MLQHILEALSGPITPVGLCAAVMWVVVKGRLVPRSWVDKTTADQESRIHFLETANSEQRATINSLVQQNAELSASGRLSVALLQTLQTGSSNHAVGIDPGSGPHVPSIES